MADPPLQRQVAEGKQSGQVARRAETWALEEGSDRAPSFQRLQREWILVPGEPINANEFAYLNWFIKL